MSFDSLLIDLKIEILIRLDAKTLLRSKLVSKQWKALINSQEFTDLHVGRSLALGQNLHFLIQTAKLHLCNHDTFADPRQLSYPNKRNDNGESCILGICRGLACVWSYHLSTLYIYNPTTQTCKILPKLKFGQVRCHYGFGYDDEGRDYKCVRIFQKLCSEMGASEIEVNVYNLKEDRWRRVESNPSYFSNFTNVCGVYFDGVVHWLGESFGTGDQEEHLPIVCFDLREESFSSIELPEIPKSDFDSMYVGVMGGQLCLVVNHSYHFELWLMKEYGVVGSWRIEYHVRKPLYYMNCESVIGFSRSGKELFVRAFSNVAKIDLDSLEISVAEVFVSRKLCDAFVCMENLMMLEDGIAGAEELEKKKPKGDRVLRQIKGFTVIP